MFIQATIYENGKKIKDLTLDEMSKLELDQDKFVWCALSEPKTEELKLVFSKIKIHELAFEDLEHGHQIAKIEEYDNDLFTVVKQMEYKDELITFGDVYLFVGTNFIVSVRKGPGEPFHGVRNLVQKNSKLLSLGTGYVLYSLIDAIIDRYFPVMTQLQAELDLLEDKMFDVNTDAEGKAKVIEQLHKMKRNIRKMQSASEPLADSIHKLFGGRVPIVCEGLDNYFRDTFDHLTKINQQLSALNDTATSSIQTTVALLTIDKNKIMKKLAAWASMFAGVTFLAGVWGMNFKHMPELEWIYGYPMALSTMVITASLLYWHFKRSKWI